MTHPNGCTLLIKSSTQNASISVPKMIQWDKLTLPNEWLLENVSKPANMATTSSNVDIIEQYLNGDVKINFADLYPSGHVQRPLANENRRNSFASSATIEGIRRKDKEIDDLLAIASKLKLESVANDSANSQIS
jgi:hypothetical protein